VKSSGPFPLFGENPRLGLSVLDRSPGRTEEKKPCRFLMTHADDGDGVNFGTLSVVRLAGFGRSSGTPKLGSSLLGWA
jgi:hypothetical protein